MVGLFVSNLLSHSTPHNLIFSKKGFSAFIIPRNGEAREIGWLDIAGFPRISKEFEFRNPDLKEILWEKISLGKNKFDTTLNLIITSLQSKYD